VIKLLKAGGTNNTSNQFGASEESIEIEARVEARLEVMA